MVFEEFYIWFLWFVAFGHLSFVEVIFSQRFELSLYLVDNRNQINGKFENNIDQINYKLKI